MSGRRAQQVSSLIRAELARILLEEVSDPGLKGISLHDVELSNDLQHAKIFFGFTPGTDGPLLEPTDAQLKEVDKGFSRAQAFFKKKLAANLELRYVPTLEFKRDTHTESLNRLYGLFEETRRDAH